jgi:hypothetical protein
MGLPAVGMTLKLVPAEGKLEARVKGPNVTPGYWRAPALTAQAFDEEGYYRLGDTFVARCRRDHRQGLAQPARRAGPSRCPAGGAIRGAGGTRRDPARRGGVAMARDGIGASFSDAHLLDGVRTPFAIALLIENPATLDSTPGRIFYGEPASTSPENAPAAAQRKQSS